MTILHISIRSAEAMRHDESHASGFMVSIQIFKAVIELWVGL